MLENVSRRGFVVSATAAAAVFGLNRQLEIIRPAAAQAAGAGPAAGMIRDGMTTFKFKVGDIEITQILDGAVERPHPKTFVKNASLDQIKAALTKAGLKPDVLPNTYTVTIARIGDTYVMFDAGNAAKAKPKSGNILDRMKDAGIDHTKISKVVVTHFHPDHIFGLHDSDGAQVYPNAEIIVPEAEYAFWTDPGLIAKLPENRKGLARLIQDRFPKMKNMSRTSGDKDVHAGIKAVSTAGHTPGHTSYLISSGAEQFMVLADLTNIPSLFLPNPGWHVVFDSDGAEAEATRRRIMEQAIADNLIVGGYHWGMPGAGRLAKDGNGYVLNLLA